MNITQINQYISNNNFRLNKQYYKEVELLSIGDSILYSDSNLNLGWESNIYGLRLGVIKYKNWRTITINSTYNQLDIIFYSEGVTYSYKTNISFGYLFSIDNVISQIANNSKNKKYKKDNS